MKKILIIEDDAAIAKGLEEALKGEGYAVASARDGEAGFALAAERTYNVIILDVMLPRKNGIDICRDLRKKGIDTPILMLTSRKEETDKVLGLELGADDYMTKPFSIRELEARIRALLRRHTTKKREETDECSFGDVKMNFRRQEATKGGKPLKLSAREFSIVKFFVQREGEVITRDMLLDSVWGYTSYPTTRTVDNYILSLRKKIENDPAKPRHFLTMHTSGYKFVR